MAGSSAAALVFAVLAACTSGPPGVTIDKTKAYGLVISDPPGILCGACNSFSGNCGSDVMSGSACSAPFDVGTSVTFTLKGSERYYYRYFCWTSEDAAPVQHACTVIVDKPITVFVEGVTGP